MPHRKRENQSQRTRLLALRDRINLLTTCTVVNGHSSLYVLGRGRFVGSGTAGASDRKGGVL